MNKITFHLKLFLFFIFMLAVTAITSAAVTRADDTDEVIVDNGIPVVYLNIDESQGTIEDLINSPDHSAYCYGTISIDVPEGFQDFRLRLHIR